MTVNPNSLEGFDRLIHAIEMFVDQVTQLQTSPLSSTGKFLSPRKRVMNYGLAWARYLSKADSAANIVLKKVALDGDQLELDVVKYTGKGKLPTNVLNTVGEFHDLRLKAKESKKPESIVKDSTIIMAYSNYNKNEVGYFVFFEVDQFTDIDALMLRKFIHTFEKHLYTTTSFEFLLDQRRLLGRRTIAAQLRPNDLLYQSLVRLHKYIDWERSAFILRGEAVNGVFEWYIAAERLRNINRVSNRVGSRARFTIDDSGYTPVDFISSVTSEADIRGVSSCQKSILQIARDTKGLPNLPEAKSILAVRMNPFSASADDEFEPEFLPKEEFVAVFTDSRTDHFNEQHLFLAREFFSEVGGLILRSNNFSKRLINLWGPIGGALLGDDDAQLGPSDYTPAEDPDVVEAIDQTSLTKIAIDVLGVDALQVLQLRRHPGTKKTTAELTVLTSVVEKKSNLPVDFCEGIQEDLKILPQADVIWDAFGSGVENVIKDDSPKGIGPDRLANIFSPQEGGKSFCSILAAPIESEKEIAGFLLAYRQKASEFIDIDHMLLRSLASRLGEKIKLHRKLADLVRLNSSLSRIALAEDTQKARKELVQSVCDLLGADFSFMMALKKGEEALVIEDVAHTWEEEMHIPHILAGEEGITGQVFTTGKPCPVSKVSEFENYVPMTTPNGKPVLLSSELAVPIKSTLVSDGETTMEVIGVLSATWRKPHNINNREVRTLEALAGPAAALLQLTSSLDETKSTRDALRKLLDLEKALSSQAPTEERQAVEWLTSTLPELVSYDLMAVWSHEKDSNKLVKVVDTGDRKDFENIGEIDFEGWTGNLIREYRQNKKVYDTDPFDSPSEYRKHIKGTRFEAIESKIAYCISPYPASTGQTDRETVWAISLYRFNPIKFNNNDVTLFQLSSEYCESALHNLHFSNTQQYALELSKVVHEVALEMVGKLRENLIPLTDFIARKASEALNAQVQIIFYDPDSKIYSTLTPYSYPRNNSSDTAPRENGISEIIRREKKTIIIDVDSPPEILRAAISTSDFLRKNPDIKLTCAVPLFDPSVSGELSFRGIMYFNRKTRNAITEFEMEFINTMARFLVECVSIGTSANRMSARALQNVLSLKEPRQVFGEVLKVALEMLKDEFPAEVRDTPGFLGGNIFMLRHAGWSRLSIRSNIGEVSGTSAGFQQIGEGVIGKVAKEGTPKIVEDAEKEPGYVQYLKDMRSELAVPIIMEGATTFNDANTVPEIAPGVIGVINIECSDAGAFTERHQKLLSHFIAQPVSVMLHLSESHERLVEQGRKWDDRFLLQVSKMLLHDLKEPMHKMGDRVADIRNYLKNNTLDKVEPILAQIEQEGGRWEKLNDSGLMLLDDAILAERKPIDVIEQTSEWVQQKKSPEVSMYFSNDNLNGFFIEKGHPNLIGMIFENLYGNSAKANSENIWMDIKTVNVEAATSQYLDIYFMDDGDGIKGKPEEIRDWLFRPFSNPPVRKEGEPRVGWGLGLSVARQMMELMDGSIDFIDSVPKVQTTFRLRFKAI